MRAQRLPRRGALPNTAALFPLRCFLSPSLSEFNEDNEVSQAHFALQQLSNTSLTREKGPERSGAQGRSSPGRNPQPRGRGRCARSRAGMRDRVGMRGLGSSSPSPAPRRGSIKKPQLTAPFKLGREGGSAPVVPGGAAMLREAVAAGTAMGSGRDRPRGSL